LREGDEQDIRFWEFGYESCVVVEINVESVNVLKR
jgi:hypothetical protein